MAFRRVYLGVGTAIVTLVGLFMVLQTLGLIITAEPVSYCNGNICESIIRITNPTGNDTDIYNRLQIQLDFTPKVKWNEFMVEDGSCKLKVDGSLSKSSTGVACGKVGWRWLNFTDETKPVKDRVYVYRFAKYSSKKYLLRGEKFSLFDKVKWGMGIGNDTIDPIWITANHYKGDVQDGKGGAYFAVVDVANLSIDKYFAKSGDEITFHYEPFILLKSKTATLSVETSKVDIITIMVRNGSKWENETVTSKTFKNVTYKNGTIEVPIEVFQNVSVLKPVYSIIPTHTFTYDNREWTGFNLNSANETTYIFKLKTKHFGEKVSYSYLLNSSTYFIEFHPELGIDWRQYLALEYTFDLADMTGGMADDLSGNNRYGHNAGGIVTGAQAAPNTGQAWQITNGDTQYINTMMQLGDFSILKNSTVLLYVSTGTTAQLNYFLYFGGTDDRTGGRMSLAETGATNVYNYVGQSADVNTCKLPIYGSWQVVTVTNNGSDIRVYSNNTLVCNGRPTINLSNEMNFTIGGDYRPAAGIFSKKMNITQACIWNQSMTATEVGQSNTDVVAGLGCGGKVFLVGNVSLSLNGLSRNLTYEFGTTATFNASVNLSNQIVCLDIYANGYNISNCGNTSIILNVTWNVLREDSFNDSTKNKTFTANSEFIIPLDNRTFLQNVSFNLTGLGNPENVTVYIQSNKTEAVFPGKLNNSVNVQNQFIYANRQYEIINLSFLSAGVQTIYANISTAGLAQLVNFTNLRINVSGFAVDAGNELDLIDNFSQSTYINFTSIVNASTNLSIWEDFVVNKTAAGINRFTGEGSCQINEYRMKDSIYPDDAGPSNGNITRVYCGTTSVQNQLYYVNEWDVRNFSRFDVLFYGQTGCSPGGDAILWAGVYDGTSFQDVLKKESGPCVSSGSTSDNINLSFRKVTNSLTDWTIYVNDVLDHTESFTLIQGGNWRFGFKLYTTPNTAVSVVNIHRIDVYAIMPIKSKDGLKYNNTISVTSVPVDTTSNNITAAYCDWIDASVENYGSINTSCELSNNGGVNWKSAPLGERVMFGIDGNSTLLWRINCTMASYNDSCIVPQVRTRIISGSVSNLSFDFGSDGIIDYKIAGFFNQTNASVLVINSSSPFKTYSGTYCGSLSTCKVPVGISTGTGGIVQINSFNYSRSVNPVFVNKTLVDAVTNMRFSVNWSNGVGVKVDDVKADFRGTKTFPVSAIFSDNIGNDGSNATFNVTIKYSPYNISLPLGVDYYEVFVPSRTAKNVTPRGQTSLVPIFNITSLAYDNGINLSVRVNETLGNQSYNVTWSLNNTRTSNFLLLNVSRFLSNISLNNKVGVWAWHDYNTTRRFIIDYFEFSSICSECFPTFDANSVNMIITD